MEDTPESRGDIEWETLFCEKPQSFTIEEKKKILSAISGVSVASDAFFPFSDNIDRAHESGATYILSLIHISDKCMLWQRQR